MQQPKWVTKMGLEHSAVEGNILFRETQPPSTSTCDWQGNRDAQAVALFFTSAPTPPTTAHHWQRQHCLGRVPDRARLSGIPHTKTSYPHMAASRKRCLEPALCL